MTTPDRRRVAEPPPIARGELALLILAILLAWGILTLAVLCAMVIWRWLWWLL